jgi:hypothetical protein
MLQSMLVARTVAFLSAALLTLLSQLRRPALCAFVTNYDSTSTFKIMPIETKLTVEYPLPKGGDTLFIAFRVNGHVHGSYKRFF